MTIRLRTGCGCSRRDFLRKGLYGVGVASGAPGAAPAAPSAALTAQALRRHQHGDASQSGSWWWWSCRGGTTD